MVSFVMLELEIITVTNLGTWADNRQPILYFLIITYILFLLKLESLSGYSIWYKQWSQISDGGRYQRKEPEGMEILFFMLC